MKYLFWILLTAFAITALAVDTYICSYSEKGEYSCHLIKEETTSDESQSEDERPVIKYDWKDI